MLKRIRTFFTILVCKAVRLVGKVVGRGSSMPGQIALKLQPDILRSIRLPEHIIAVTGSNGKTSTVEMIAHTLSACGKRVAWNREGSNQIEGVTTFLLDDCTLSGKVRSEIILLETDERFARHTFRYFTPSLYVITNLYRDQMTRNGHPEWIYHIIEESIHDRSHLLLNADDPLVSCFGWQRENVTYFGVARMPFSETENTSIYDDGKYCPLCKGRMEYDYYHYNHIGSYHCTQCGYHRMTPAYTVTDASLEEGWLVINEENRIPVAFSSIYHFYNTLAAFAVADKLSIPHPQIVSALSGYAMKSGRVLSFRLGERAGTLLTSKHENSVSYDQSIRVALQDPNPFTALFIIDAVSRKYFTSETSWIWDIDFERLADPRAAKIVLAGTYCNDLAVRFSYCGIPEERIQVFESIDDAAEYLKAEAVGYIYAITCFSDKEKFLAKTQVQ